VPIFDGLEGGVNGVLAAREEGDEPHGLTVLFCVVFKISSITYHRPGFKHHQGFLKRRKIGKINPFLLWYDIGTTYGITGPYLLE
jgi:hypothetical protein